MTENKIDEVRAFWDAHVCGDVFTDLTERFSKSYLDEVRHQRYYYEYHLMPFIKRCADSGKNVLEIGCSMGMDLGELVKMGCKCTGVDLSPESLKVAEYHFKLEGLNADLKVDNAEKLSFPDNSFDCVYSFGVLHHTPNIEKSIDEVYRVLRPGGKAFLMLYARYSLNNLVHVIFCIPYESPRDKQIDAPITRTFSKKEIQDLLVKFKNLRIEKRYLFGAGWRPVSDIVPEFLNDAFGRVMGWHWMIEAQKPES